MNISQNQNDTERNKLGSAEIHRTGKYTSPHLLWRTVV